MKTLKKTRVFNTPRQKVKEPLNPDKIFLIYTGISWILKFLINFFPGPRFFEKPIRVELTFLISVFLTFSFIIYCYLRKVDWYGKKRNAAISSLRKWTQKHKWRNVLFFLILFVLDPFLFFIYFKNDSQKIIWQILAWLLLLSSLLLNSFLLMKLGNPLQSFF